MAKVDLTDRERVVLWVIGSWFSSPSKPRLVTGSLTRKLYIRNAPDMAKKYDQAIYDRIIKLGKWLEKKREAGEL